MPVLKSDYIPPRFLTNGHLHTAFAYLFRRLSTHHFLRERIETHDGDFLDLDWSRAGSRSLVILSHGLEGSSREPYVVGMSKAFNRIGWDSLAWNFRSCSGEPNRLLISYHSGKTDDLDTVIRHAIKKHGYRRIVLVGFSLGGNITLKYLGECGKDLPSQIQKAVAFSVPCHLKSSAYRLAHPINKIYMTLFLFKFYGKVRDKMKLYPHLINDKGFWRMRSFKEFDSRYTAPLHGFKSVEEYWRNSSSGAYLNDIRIPTLVINARDDPFLTPKCFPFKQARNNPNLYFEAPDGGGHVGFVAFNEEGEYWSEQRAISFVEQSGIEPLASSLRTRRSPI